MSPQPHPADDQAEVTGDRHFAFLALAFVALLFLAQGARGWLA